MKKGKGKSESNNDQRYNQANKNATMDSLAHGNFIASLFDFRRVMHILWLTWGEGWYVKDLDSGI